MSTFERTINITVSYRIVPYYSYIATLNNSYIRTATSCRTLAWSVTSTDAHFWSRVLTSRMTSFIWSAGVNDVTQWRFASDCITSLADCSDNKANKAIVDNISPRCANHDDNFRSLLLGKIWSHSWLLYDWRVFSLLINRRDVLTGHCIKTCHPQNRKYITYRKATKGGSSHDPRQQTQNING